jgi:DHA2 family methylenomycin A resistance protein-like MFS transporter
MTVKDISRVSLTLTTIAASFAFALVQLDVTIVNVALPTIARALNARLSGLQWVVDAYALSFAALLLSGGYFGDRHGAKRVFLAGLAIFAGASLICGLAVNAPMLIAGRMVQGVGAAAMLPCSLTLINHAAEGHPARRAQAIGWWTAAGSITIAAGPIVGGALLGVAGWRSIFLVNLPLCLVGALLTLRVDETERLPDGRRFDGAGQVLGILALAALTAAVIEAKPLGPGSPMFLGCALVGVISAIAFIRHEARTPAPMLPLSLFRSRSFGGAVVFGAIVNLTYYGVVFVLSLYLQRVLGYTPVMAGLAFLPLTATFFAVNLISGWWVGRAGSRAPMIVGALIDAAGFGLLAFIAHAGTPYWQLGVAFVLIPAGMGLGVPAMTTAVLASVARERSGVASAVLNAARQAAGAIGVAVFGALAGDAPAHVVGGLRLGALLAVALLIAVSLAAAATIGRPPERPVSQTATGILRSKPKR